MCVRARMCVHEVNKGQVPNFSTIGKLTISQPRRGLFEVCKSLKPSSRPAPGERTTIRNLLSSTTPFGGYKETPVLTELEPFLEGDPFTKVDRYDPWSTVTSRVEVGLGRGLSISEISTKMRLASHTHGSAIPWNTP